MIKPNRSSRLGGTTLLIAAILAAPAALPAQDTTPAAPQMNLPGSAPAADSPEVTEIREELAAIQERLATAQRSAYASEAVQAERTEHEKHVRDAIIKEEPTAEKLLEQQDQLIAELSSSSELQKPAAERSPEFQQKVQAYQTVYSQVQPLAEKVAAEPAVANSFQKFRAVVEKEMARIEPEMDDLLDRRNKLASRYQNLVGNEG